MPRPPRLIAELVTLTKSWGWSLHDLAHELDVSYATLKFYRAGTRDLTMPVYSRIAKRFGEQHRPIKDLLWQYATTLGAPEVAEAVDDAHDIQPRDIHVLRTYVDRFGAESIHGGRGLFLVADNPKMLRAAVAFLGALFSRADVKVAGLSANRIPSASEQRAALAAPLLIVERVDFLHSANADLIRRRADLLRPTVVTSMEPPTKMIDPYLRRIFLSVMRTVLLTAQGATEPAPSLPSSSHAAA